MKFSVERRRTGLGTWIGVGMMTLGPYDHTVPDRAQAALNARAIAAVAAENRRRKTYNNRGVAPCGCGLRAAARSSLRTGDAARSSSIAASLHQRHASTDWRARRRPSPCGAPCPSSSREHRRRSAATRPPASARWEASNAWSAISTAVLGAIAWIIAPRSKTGEAKPIVKTSFAPEAGQQTVGSLRWTF